MPSSPIRVSFVTHYAELYGANRSLLALLDGSKSLGIDARVIGPEPGELFEALAERGIPAAICPFEWWVSSRRSSTAAAGRAFRNLRHVKPIVRQLAAWGTDVVYSNASVFDIGAMAAAELGIPHIWHLREFGRRDYDLRPDFGRRMHRLGFLSAAATICVSHAIRRSLLDGADRPGIHVVSNGVGSTAEFDARREASRASRSRAQAFAFVLVGRFRESKGQHLAIEAFAEVATARPDVKLLLVGGAGGTGDRAYFERCQELARELGIVDRVEFWGYVPDPERAFLAADAALMLSRSEAMGRVTVEAMSCERPVIGFDAAGTSELIDHGQTGLLYRGGIGELAVAMRHYADNPNEAIRHGEAGWAVACGRNATEVYAARIRDIINSVARTGTTAK
jgi:glycosyltransferase involved in cell wall biosynthesis